MYIVTGISCSLLLSRNLLNNISCLSSSMKLGPDHRTTGELIGLSLTNRDSNTVKCRDLAISIVYTFWDMFLRSGHTFSSVFIHRYVSICPAADISGVSSPEIRGRLKQQWEKNLFFFFCYCIFILKWLTLTVYFSFNATLGVYGILTADSTF